MGLRNYLTQLEDPLFRRTLFLTVLFTAEAVVIKFAIAGLAALALHQLRGWRFAGVLTALILAPFIVPEVVTAAIWRFLYNPTFGGLNATLRALYDLTGGLIGSAQGLPGRVTPPWPCRPWWRSTCGRGCPSSPSWPWPG